MVIQREDKMDTKRLLSAFLAISFCEIAPRRVEAQFWIPG